MERILSNFRSLSPTLRKTVIFLSSVGFLTFLGTLIGLLSLLQSYTADNQQNDVNSTQVSVMFEQLAVQQQILTLQSGILEKEGNLESTRVLEEIERLRSTQDVLEKTLVPPKFTAQYIESTVLSKITNTPAYPMIYASQDIEISKKQTKSIFNGEIYITLLDASPGENHFTVDIFTPGFSDLILDRYPIGEKEVYESTGRFEIHLLSYDSYPDRVNIRITYLGPTEIAKKILQPVQIQEISQQDTIYFFGNDVSITVDKIDPSNNQYSFIVSTYGEEPVEIEDVYISYKMPFKAKSNYEIRLLGYETFPEKLEIMVAKIIP